MTHRTKFQKLLSINVFFNISNQELKYHLVPDAIVTKRAMHKHSSDMAYHCSTRSFDYDDSLLVYRCHRLSSEKTNTRQQILSGR